MFSHLSLRPSPANNHASPPFLKDSAQKFSGNTGKLLDDVMAKSNPRDEAARGRSTPSKGISADRNRDNLSPCDSTELYTSIGREYGRIRAFDPVTEIGMIWLEEESTTGVIPFDTEGMSLDLLTALKEDKRGMNVVFKARRVDNVWTATSMGEASLSQPSVCKGKQQAFEGYSPGFV